MLANQKSMSVKQALDAQMAQRELTNSKVYLVSRGCVYEHHVSDFRYETLSRDFTRRNEEIARHLKHSNTANLAAKKKLSGASHINMLTRTHA